MRGYCTACRPQRQRALHRRTIKAAGYQDVSVGDRTFLMVPNEDYSETTGYEVVDGKAERVFRIPGSSYNIVKLR